MKTRPRREGKQWMELARHIGFGLAYQRTRRCDELLSRKPHREKSHRIAAISVIAGSLAAPSTTTARRNTSFALGARKRDQGRWRGTSVVQTLELGTHPGFENLPQLPYDPGFRC